MARRERRERLVHLGDMAEIINTAYALSGPDKVKPRAPLMWWWRTRNGGIKTPLPKPYMMIGKRPVWRREAIIDWYERFIDAQTARTIGPKV